MIQFLKSNRKCNFTSSFSRLGCRDALLAPVWIDDKSEALWTYVLINYFTFVNNNAFNKKYAQDLPLSYLHNYNDPKLSAAFRTQEFQISIHGGRYSAQSQIG